MQNNAALSKSRSEEVQQKLDDVISRYGKWTSHRIELPGNIFTIPKSEFHDVISLRRVAQIVSDNLSKSLSESRILDLGCLEGGYSIEMALGGADVVGIEGREINIEKARFAKDALALSNAEFAQDDVRNLSSEKYGVFDAVLALGILYHLDGSDIFHFLRKMHEVCREFIVIDTTISMNDRDSIEHEGKTYWGQRWTEFNEGTDETAKSKNAWASLDNNTSFSLTKPSLYNALRDAGFTSVYECHQPADIKNYQDRVTLLARKGVPVSLKTQPDITPPADDFPEKETRRIGAFYNRPPEKKPSLLRRIANRLSR